MTQKKMLVLLAFSLCLNASFLITALLGRWPTENRAPKHPIRAYSRHIELLKGLDLTDETFKKARGLLDTFMEKRAALIAEKLDQKIETLALLEKNPLLPRKELEALHSGEVRIEETISTLGIDHTLQMRQLIPPNKMALFYTNAGKLIRAHRERIVQLKGMTH